MVDTNMVATNMGTDMVATNMVATNMGTDIMVIEFSVVMMHL